MSNWKRTICIVALIGWGSYFVFALSGMAMYEMTKTSKGVNTASEIMIFSIAVIYTIFVNILAWRELKKKGINFSSKTPLFVWLAGYLPGFLLEFGYFQYFEPKDKKYGIVSVVMSLIGFILLVVSIILPIGANTGLIDLE